MFENRVHEHHWRRVCNVNVDELFFRGLLLLRARNVSSGPRKRLSVWKDSSDVANASYVREFTHLSEHKRCSVCI